MQYYPTILTLHIIFAGLWLSNFIIDIFFRRIIFINKQKAGERKFIIVYIKFINLIGMIGSIGILLSGIVITSLNPGYGFFQMTANHWLLSKQILMVVLLLIIFTQVIPKAKKLKNALGSDLESNSQISDEGYEYLNKLYKLGTLINSFVLVNFLFAISHRFLG